MSKSSDQELFTTIVQRHLQAEGHYEGEIDAWPGPATQRAWRDFLGEPDTQPSPIIQIPDGGSLPQPASIYELPRETTAALNSYYGTAAKKSNYLTWFSFPCDGIRLYTRTGQLVTDRTGDNLPDHRAHKQIVGRLQAALLEIYITLGDKEFRRQGWHIYGGCHNYRTKTGGSGLSVHSWGIAIDENPGENPYAKRTTTFSESAINIMEKWGFLSGGRAWGLDWMHFQAAIPNLSAGSYYSIHGFPKNIRAI